MFADVLIAHPMIAIILISRHAAEDFHLESKGVFSAAAAKNGGIVQILRESFALPFANQTAKGSFAVAASQRQPARHFVKQTQQPPRRGSGQS
jgi:hypothetical protein